MNQLQLDKIQQNKNYETFYFCSRKTKNKKIIIFVHDQNTCTQQTVTEHHKFHNNIVILSTKQKS
jgi:hypothetical protein